MGDATYFYLNNDGDDWLYVNNLLRTINKPGKVIAVAAFSSLWRVEKYKKTVSFRPVRMVWLNFSVLNRGKLLKSHPCILRINDFYLFMVEKSIYIYMYPILDFFPVIQKQRLLSLHHLRISGGSVSFNLY